MRLISTPCTLIVVGSDAETDDFDPENLNPEESEVETVCSLQPRQREEPSDEGELSRIDADIFFPAGTEVRAPYKVRVDDELWEIIGDGSERRSLTGYINHVEASARRAGGDPQEGGS